jgi:hypothetical protein
MEKLKELLMSFFKNRGSKVVVEADYVLIENIDKEIEEEYGKKSPYKISFEEKDKFSEKLECFYPGSRLFNLVRKHLNKDATTTILKINLDIDPLEQIENKISLKNCILKEIKKSYENNFFSRFTFKTSIKYFNKNEEIINEIFVHNEKIIRGDLENYIISSGDLKEIDTKYMEKDYKFARDAMREILKPKIDEIKIEISKMLEREMGRIREHYIVQKKELNSIIEKNEKKLKDLEVEEKTPDSLEKIRKMRSLIDHQNISEALKKISREEEFAINDEKQKHSVSIDTKLANTTVIYYPLYKLNLELVDGNVRKNFQIIYDPLTMEMSNHNCFSCKREMKEIALCSAGHVCCPECLFRCVGCGSQFCKICLSEMCNSCAGPICKNCRVECKNCKKTFCKQHIREDSFSKENYCSDCMSSCSECLMNFLEQDLIEISSGKRICFKCQARYKKEKVLKQVFDE